MNGQSDIVAYPVYFDIYLALNTQSQYSFHLPSGNLLVINMTDYNIEQYMFILLIRSPLHWVYVPSLVQANSIERMASLIQVVGQLLSSPLHASPLVQANSFQWPQLYLEGVQTLAASALSIGIALALSSRVFSTVLRMESSESELGQVVDLWSPKFASLSTCNTSLSGIHSQED